MCYQCYIDYGSPQIVNQDVLKTSELIKRVMLQNPTGGNAHIVLDDFNLEDENIQWCLDNLISNYHESTSEQLVNERNCLESLLRLNLDERVSALALYEKYI